jgi:hypothetical protein
MKLLKINEIEKRESWDIEVENSHNFYGNGVLLHNSNAGIALYADGTYKFQSRENELSFGHDNAGFMTALSNKSYKKLFEGIEFKESCVIYGEWIGAGVQSKVAIAQLSKRLIIFAVRIDGVYQDMENFKHVKNEAEDIYNILQFPHWFIDIDFNRPELSQNKIVDLTLAIEAECPVGKYFGVEGVGEGLVAEYIFPNGSDRYIFKSKGLLHANGSKVKTIRVVNEDKVNALLDLADELTPEWRLDQMVTESCDLLNGGIIDRTKMGVYMKMVVADIIKEESDKILESGYEMKDLGKYISEIAKKYFFEREKTSEY